MKPLLTLAILLLTASVHAACPPGLVRVYVYEDSDTFPDSMASGALVSPTLILTNWHVVKDRRLDRHDNNRSIEIRFVDGSRSFAAVVQQSQKWDVALLRVHPVKFVPFIVGTDQEPGTRLTAQGFGFDYEYRASKAELSGRRFYPAHSSPETTGDFFMLQGYAARPGDSGGPVTDTHGRLVGILYAADQGNSCSMGIRISRIVKVLGDNFKPTRVSEDFKQ